MKRLFHWAIDYAYMANGWRLMYQYRKPPKHYLGHIIEGKNPVILIPGITNKWGFMKRLGDKVSLAGHPVYIVPELGHNIRLVTDAAKLVEIIISDNDLKNVTIIAHSKGALIAKYLLNHSKYSSNISKIIAIAAPFHGSKLVKYLPIKPFKELRPDSNIVQLLNSKTDNDHKIFTISPQFDNHVWHTNKNHLKSAGKNITADTKGHHKILFDTTVINTVLDII